MAERRRGAIHWYSDSLTPTLAKLVVAIEANVTIIMEQQAKRVEKYMKQNAPWNDRTGDARDGLSADAEASIDEFIINLSHGVDYGYWLEVRWNGKYAIIEPTIEEMGPQVMSSLDGVLVRSSVTARLM